MLENITQILQTQKGQPIAIATSGGVDSMTLCALVLSSGLFCDITLLHVDHNLRTTAKRDYDLVKKFAAHHNLKFESISIDVGALAKKNKQSIETEARNVRYKFFSEFSKKTGAAILLGHTLDDNAETILMHIFRGCGLNGLVGMSEKSDYPCNIIRPLINITKQEIYEYAKANGVEFNEDETNSDTRYARNMTRKALSEIVVHYPSANENIAKLSEVAKKALKAAQGQLSEEYFKLGDGVVYLSKAVKDTLIADYYIIEAAKRVGLVNNLESKHIAAILGLENGKRLDLPSGFRVYSDKNEFAFQLLTTPPQSEGVFVGHPFKGGEFVCQPPAANHHQPLLFLSADADKLEGAVLRFRKDGDKFTKFGGKTKKLKDFFNERGVPSRERDAIPLLVKDDKILVVIGYEIADEVRVSKDTKRIVKLWKE